MKQSFAGAVAGLALMSMASAAQAQIAVSANDGKQLRPGETPASRTPDSVAVIDLGQSPPRILGQVAAPASLIGPPSTVAVASASSFAIVSAPQRLDPADTTKVIGNDTISVIDLRTPSSPRLAQTLQAGTSPAGVSINRARTLALVANSGDDSISIFTIRNRTLTPAGKFALDPQSRPTDVLFTPDGRGVLVVAQGPGKIIRLSLRGSQLAPTGVEIATGVQPYGAVISRDGAYAFNTNLGGRLAFNGAVPAVREGVPRMGSLSVIDLKANRLASALDVGYTPEHVSVSPDGRYLQTHLVNGSTAAANSPAYNPFGLIKVFRIAEGGALVQVAEARTGQWCQGSVWRQDGRRIYLQCSMGREIEAYDFDGASLTRAADATLKFDSRPGGMSAGNVR